MVDYLISQSMTIADSSGGGRVCSLV